MAVAHGGTSSLALGAVAVTTLLVLRALRRRLSPVITSKLACRCGKVQGEISAIRQDSMRIHCYCGDCRQYARFIANLGKQEEKTIGEHGDNRVVQVCKSALKIRKGQELIKLARKAPKPEKSGQIYMHRYRGCWETCCTSPVVAVCLSTTRWTFWASSASSRTSWTSAAQPSRAPCACSRRRP
ncbi:unnamed protein product [Effrenium voratum]|nr:unnamed protein product [Effrenium voratum]